MARNKPVYYPDLTTREDDPGFDIGLLTREGPPWYEGSAPTDQVPEGESRFVTTAKKAETSAAKKSQRQQIEIILREAGVNVDDERVQLVIESAGDQILDPAIGPAIVAGLAAQYPDTPTTSYSQALQVSGFDGDFIGPQPVQGQFKLGAEEPAVDVRAGLPKYETQPDTGFIRYKNGVLVSPEGDVVFDPTSTAPGSLRWQREVVSQWGDEKVAEWRKRLHEFGYLTSDQVKVKGIDTPFLNALSSYHTSRYLNGGKAVAGDLAGTGAASKPPLVNFEDMQHQIGNDVREQYRRVFGADPTPGEVEAWRDYIIRTGMDLQKEFRKKNYGSYTSMAATEAEEQFITKLENSPGAKFLRGAEEENTRMRDALEQAVVVTNSLAG